MRASGGSIFAKKKRGLVIDLDTGVGRHAWAIVCKG